MKLRAHVRAAAFGGAFALLAGGPTMAMAEDSFDVDESIAAVSDAGDLDDILDASDVDQGVQSDMHDANDEAQSDDGTVESDMEDGVDEASHDQEDADEATQEERPDDDDSNPPPG